MENEQHKIIDVWKKNQFKNVKLQIVQYKNKTKPINNKHKKK